jgi:hypothetical protein
VYSFPAASFPPIRSRSWFCSPALAGGSRTDVVDAVVAVDQLMFVAVVISIVVALGSDVDVGQMFVIVDGATDESSPTVSIIADVMVDAVVDVVFNFVVVSAVSDGVV